MKSPAALMRQDDQLFRRGEILKPRCRKARPASSTARQIVPHQIKSQRQRLGRDAHGCAIKMRGDGPARVTVPLSQGVPRAAHQFVSFILREHFLHAWAEPKQPRFITRRTTADRIGDEAAIWRKHDVAHVATSIVFLVAIQLCDQPVIGVPDHEHLAVRVARAGAVFAALSRPSRSRRLSRASARMKKPRALPRPRT